MSEQIRNLIQKAGDDRSVVERLRRDPASLRQEFDLSDADVDALKQADCLVVEPENPLVAADVITLPPITITGIPPTTMTTSPITITADAPTTITTSPITITVTAAVAKSRDSEESDPGQLDDLSYDDLLKLVERLLDDPGLAARIRRFLGIGEG